MKTKKNWYPWLNNSYRKIISFYKNKFGHHAFLLFSKLGMGGSSLIYAVIRYLMCNKVVDNKICNNCENCNLIKSDSHPDLYRINFENEKKVGIQNVRFLIDCLTTCAHQNSFKIIWISFIEKMTEEAINALLKTLEEPNDHTYFFLECYDSLLLNKKIKSRCLCYFLQSPKEEEIYFWLKKKNLKKTKEELKTAIKVSMLVPLDALSLLTNESWELRKKFYELLSENLVSKTILNFLPELNRSDVINRINWLITFLLDSLKYNVNIRCFLINEDQLYLIKKIALFFSSNFFWKSIYNWKICRYNLISVISLNKESQLIAELANWQDILLKYVLIK